MQIKNKSGASLIFSLGVSLALVVSQLTPAVAQTNSADDGYQSNEQDAVYGGGTFGDLNPMDLIHNLKFQNNRNSNEFNQDSQVQINNSASDFKKQQQQRILESQSNNNSTESEATVAE